MEDQSGGRLILKSIPSEKVEKQVNTFLNRYFSDIADEEVNGIIKNMPAVINRPITEKEGQILVSNLEMLGAKATFVPKDSVATGVTSDGYPEIPPEKVLKDNKPANVPPIDFTYQTATSTANWKSKLIRNFEQVNKELWVIVSMFVIVGIMNYLVTAHRMLLGLYTLPTIFSAYHYGRRHATLTALASLMLVGLVAYFNPSMLASESNANLYGGRWFDLGAWGGILMITAYAMGTLYKKNTERMNELRKTYQGIIVILRHFISKDQYTENHCYRVSIYAAKIASIMGFSPQHVEDIRSAALLHDIGKVDISREILYKAANLNWDEFQEVKQHVNRGVGVLDPVSSPLGRIIPIILAHHERFDGSGYHNTKSNEIPLEARILVVADVYDALISDRPYRKAMSPFEAKEVILKGSGTDFDPKVVGAFIKAFDNGEMEVPNVMI